MKPDDTEILNNRNLVKASTHSMPTDISGAARVFMNRAESRAQRRDVANDPAMNPAGKGSFSGSYAPFREYSHQYTYANKDKGHAARLRGAKARSWADKAMKR